MAVAVVNAVELGVAYLSLVVETSGIPTQVRRSLAGLPAEGRTAGAALGKQLSDAAARTASFDKLKASAGAAQLASAKATEALSAAQARARGASSALAVAEQRLTEIRARSGAKTSQIMAAEAAVSKAREADSLAQSKVAAAYQASTAAKTKAVGAAGQLAVAETRQAAAAGTLGAAQLKGAAASNQFGASQAGAVAATTRLGQAQATAGVQTKAFAASQTTAVQSLSALGAGQTRAAQAAAGFAASQVNAARSGESIVNAQRGVAAAFASDAGVKLKSAEATNAFASASGRVPASLSTIGGALSRVGVDLTGMTTQAGRGAEALAALGSPGIRGQIAMVGDTIKQSLGFGLAAGITAATGSAVKLESTFSQTMGQVAAATAAPAEQMKSLGDLAIKLGADTSFSAGEAADAMLELAKAGLSPATIESGALSATLTQAAASGDSLGESAGAIGNALNMFSLKGEQAAEVAAAFAGGANASTAEIKDLTYGLAQVGPGAAAAGMSIQEVVGTLSAFNNAGLSGSDAGTSLKQMLTSLVPSSETASNAMASIGLYAENAGKSIDFLAMNGIKVKNNSKDITAGFIQLAQKTAGAGASTEELSKAYGQLRRDSGAVSNGFFDANGKMKSAVEIADLLQKATKNLSAEERIYTLNKIFGSDASRAANILAKEGAAGLAKYIDATKNAGAAQDMANARMGGTAGALERLSGAWETFRLQIGQALAPYIQVAADALGNSLELMSGALKVIVPLLASSVVAWGTYTAVMKGAAIATQLVELWTKRAAIAQLIMSRALMLNPFAAAAAAVVVLGLGLVTLWKQSATFRNVVTGAFNAVKGVIAAAWGVIEPVLSGMGRYIGETIGPALVELGDAVAKRFGQIKGAVSGFGESIKGAFAPVAPALTTAGRAIATVAGTIGNFIGSQLLNTLRTAVSGVVDVFKGLVTAVAGIIRVFAAVLSGDWGKAWEGLQQIASGAVRALLGAVKVAFAPLIGLVSTVAGSAVGAFSAAWSGIAGAAATAWGKVTSVVKGAWSVLSPIFSTIGNVVGTVLKAAFYVLQVAVVASAGAIILAVQALWAGAKLVFDGIVKLINVAVVPAWKAMSSAITAVWNTILTKVFTPLRTWITATLVSGFQLLRSAVVTVWNAVATTISAAWNTVLTKVFTPLRTWVSTTLTGMWNTFRGLVSTVWSAITTAISAAWNTIVTKVFTPIRSWVTSILTPMWNTFRTLVGNVWSAITTTVSNAWNTVLTRVFTPLRTWVASTLTAAFRTLQSVASTVWGAVTSTISNAWTKVSGTFTALRNGLKGVWDYFATAVNGIGKTWDGIKEKTTAPVKYVVNSVVRDKLVGAWNAVAGKLSLPKFNFPGWAAGGWTGPGGTFTPAGVVHADEFVVRKSSRRRIERTHPGLLDYVNQTGALPGYSGGGRVQWDSERPGPKMGAGPRTTPITGNAPPDQGVWRQMITWLKRNIPGARVTSAYRRTYTATGKVSNHARGLAVDIVGSGATTLMEIFNKILAAQGSRSIELIHSQAGNRQIYRGKPHYYTGVTRANHFDHVHWSVPSMDPSIPADFSGVGGSSGPNPVAELLKGLVNPLFSGARGLIDGMGGVFGSSPWVDIAKAGAKMPVNQVSDWVLAKIDQMFPGSTGGAADAAASVPSGAGAGSLRTTVQKIAAQRGWGSGAQWDALQWIIGRESSWSPTAQNPKSTAYGLFQFLNSTWAGTGYTKSSDPTVQTLAGLKYIANRYGDPVKAKAFWERNNWYDRGGQVAPVKLFDGGGILERGDVALHNARRPDRVLTERQWNAVERYLPVQKPDTVSSWARTSDGGLHIHGDVYGDPERFARKVTTRMRDELALVELAGV